MESKDILVEGDARGTALKLLDVLKQEDMIGHKTFTVADITYQKNAPLRRICRDDCKLCELEKILKEG